MMARIVKGSDFKGVVDYILDKSKATQLVAHEGLFMENKETIAMSFNAQSRMNSKVSKPVGHIAFNRIDNNGNTISDRHERLRSTRICKELTMKYGLYMANGKDNVKRNRLKEPDRTKYELYDILKTEVGRCGNWNVLVDNLKRQGVEVHFSYRGQTNEVQGVVFTMNGYHFNGSLGLLNGNGSSYNAADAEVNQEMAEILRRKKNAKRKRGLRL